MSTFKYPVSVRVDNEEDQTEVLDRLKQMGYCPTSITTKRESNTICTNYLDRDDSVTNLPSDRKEMFNRYYCEDNKELFFALAGMREGEDFHIGEIVMWICKEHGYSVNGGALARIVGKDTYSKVEWLSDANGQHNGQYSEKYFRKLTKEEIISRYTTKQTDMKKIIGYKAPFDMYKGQVKKGQIFRLDKASTDKTEWSIPFEIVETWEAVYEEEYKVGDWVIFKKGYDHIEEQDSFIGVPIELTEIIESSRKRRVRFNEDDGWSYYYENIERKATPEEMEKVWKVTIESYHMKIEGATFGFGCQKGFTLEDVEAYRKLLKAGVKMERNGLSINEMLLNRIETKMKS